MAVYLDTSALVELVVKEDHSDELRAWLEGPDGSMVPDGGLVTSDLARTELMRAVRREAPESAEQARELLDSLTLMSVTAHLFELAGRLEPATLRSLDAVHLACALDLDDDLEALVVYDTRLSEAARAYGIHVEAPGLSNLRS